MAIIVSGTLTAPDGSPIPFLNIVIRAVQSVPGAVAIPNQASVIEQTSATGAYSFTLEEGVYGISLSGPGLGPVALGQAVVNSSSLDTDLITLIGVSGVPTSTIQAAIVVASQQAATTVTVGTTTTGAPGTAAEVTNSGTPNAVVLDFTIPQSAPALQLPASVTISANTAVAVVNGQLVPAQSGVAAQLGNVVGISSNGGQTGTLIDVQQSGEMSLSSWNWVLGQPVYVGPNGPLTQTPPSSGFLQVVGVPLSATSISIGLQPPISIV